MHEPTPPARRVAALRYQAERLLRDAAAWGYCVSILPQGEAEILKTDPVNVYVNIDHEQSRQPPHSDELPQQSGGR